MCHPTVHAHSPQSPAILQLQLVASANAVSLTLSSALHADSPPIHTSASELLGDGSCAFLLLPGDSPTVQQTSQDVLVGKG